MYVHCCTRYRANAVKRWALRAQILVGNTNSVGKRAHVTQPALKFANPSAEHGLAVKIFIGEDPCRQRKQRRHAPRLEDDRKRVDFPTHDKVDSSKSLRPDQSDGVRLSHIGLI